MKSVTKAKKAYEKVAKTSKPGTGARFKALEKVVKAWGARNPAAVVAAIGRKKYGNKKMTKMAVMGKKK